MLPDKIVRPVILSLAGPVFTDDEQALFREFSPLGVILFARNCESPDQLRRLTDAVHEAAGWQCPVLIDQEGGRVQRLKPPIWRKYPPMKAFGDEVDTAEERLRFTILQMAEELLECGITVNCAPVLDVLTDQTHEAIGDRAFSVDPAIVARLGQVVCEAFLSAGVTPVMKHLPGHGRARSDSHKDLPHVETEWVMLDATDFAPFRAVSHALAGRGVWGMVAHVVYDAIDPVHPASVSPDVIQGVIRERIGFDGLLLSDDLDMAALAGYGDVAERARLTLGAGCDVALYCSGRRDDMVKIMEYVPKMTEKTRERLQNTAELSRLRA